MSPSSRPEPGRAGSGARTCGFSPGTHSWPTRSPLLWRATSSAPSSCRRTPQIAATGRHYGAEVPFLRPPELADDLSPDIAWVRFTIGRLADEGRHFDAFSILRPTSPLRQADTIRRAWAEFSADPEAESLRAVEPCRQHPAKMWVRTDHRVRPLLESSADPPLHSRPYQDLAPVLVQNASLEVAWVRTLRETGTISGSAVRPFQCEAYEGFDLNDEADWWVLERILADGLASLPEVRVAAAVGPKEA